MDDGSVEKWQRADEEVRKNLPPGVKLVHTLRGHTGSIHRIAWSPDGLMLASPSSDTTIRLWNTETGECLNVLRGHTDFVFSIVFAPSGKNLVSTSKDGTLNMWESESGKLIYSLKDTSTRVSRVAFHPDGHMFAGLSNDNMVILWDTDSGELIRYMKNKPKEIVFDLAFDLTGRKLAGASAEGKVKIWDITSGKLSHSLIGHRGAVTSIAFDLEENILASASLDKTVNLWNTQSGQLLLSLEGHTNGVVCVSFSSDGQILASTSYENDRNIRFWRKSNGTCVATIPELSSERSFRSKDGTAGGIVFHPFLPLIATIGSDFGTTEDILDNIIHIYELDLQILLGQPSTSSISSVTYTSAKVVLVGDTGVGKSGLAERLVHGKFVPTVSSHARRAHLLESKVVKNSDKTMVHREIILWDLAGQPAYRLVHQLSIDNAALACVLFDARSETNPFEGAAYWSQVLDQAHTNTKKKLIKFLVASRSDVGGLPAGSERIDTFVYENGFAGFFKTSAKTGKGCKELLKAIRQEIQWDDLPSVSSPEVLRKLRDFVTILNPARSAVGAREMPALMTITELLQRFESAFHVKVPVEEFITYLQRLEASDTLDLLVFHTTGETPKLDDKVLLDTTRVDAYASIVTI
ncbi:GTPase [Methanosarcina sp. DH1]|uniref:WD40 domain-containing protein n=1 Tax=Methanosarcina sp. DH1 TaxID=2605695 RepID=UPI001E5407C7|nr:GTPase [Methanosarcina sp. DH1]